jgi:hypothetical protein
VRCVPPLHFHVCPYPPLRHTPPALLPPTQVVAPYAKAIVEAAYPSDKAVADDKQVQAFAAALVSPHGSNLVRINDADNALKTRAQLAKFLEDFITIVMTHGSAHLQVSSVQHGTARHSTACSINTAHAAWPPSGTVWHSEQWHKAYSRHACTLWCGVSAKQGPKLSVLCSMAGVQSHKHHILYKPKPLDHRSHPLYPHPFRPFARLCV